MPLVDKLRSPDVDTSARATRFEALVGQEHLFSSWADAGVDEDKKCALLLQLESLENSYPGGLAAYIESARTLLAQSQRGENPLAGWSPSVPEDGYDLAPGTPMFEEYERIGLEAAEAGQLAFVVPAGGLGERLGYHGVKFALPVDTHSGACVLAVYCGYIRELERRAASQGRKISLPLAIMVSSDTEAGISELLDANSYFGLARDQVSFLRQEKVAALSNAEAAFALASPYEIATKPHGHGDIHFLLHSTGTARRWHERGVQWLHFFQDTNTLYFSNFLATLGVSVRHGIAVNLVATPRKAKEAIGAVCKLTHTDGRTMVCNVEYNQLEPLLIASGHTEGDVNESNGFSRYPGNINQIIINLGQWLENVERTGGAIDEFINPKYADEERKSFKSPTRLECMMQDYVKTVPTGHIVAWTRYPQEYGYFPCKNDIRTGAKLSSDGVPPHSASSAEMAVYHMHASELATMGAVVGGRLRRVFRGVGVEMGPSVVFMPSFAPCFTVLKEKLSKPSKLKVSARSSLVIMGSDIIIEELDLDGALVIDVADGGSLRIAALQVRNAGWGFEELNDDEMATAPEEDAIRGFRLVKRETRTIRVDKGQQIVLDGKMGRPLKLAPVSTGATRKHLKEHGFQQLQKSGKDLHHIDPNHLNISIKGDKEAGCCAVL